MHQQEPEKLQNPSPHNPNLSSLQQQPEPISQQLQSDQQPILLQPKTYFELIQKVGCQGPYQRNVFLIFFCNWFIASLLIMGTSFLFLNPRVDCEAHGIETDDCEEYVCSLPENQRSEFYEKQEVVSLATEFGPFHCEKRLELDALRMVLYIGTFFGYIGVLYITDNYGRKFSIVVAWAFTLAGIIVLSISVNIEMACIGLFLAGVGCESGIRISMAVFGEIVDYVLRQKYSVALQISFGLGEITIGVMYYLIRDWRWVTIGFCLIPAIVQMLLLALYLEQTPKFAIKKDKIKAIRSLNRIGSINNKKRSGILSTSSQANQPGSHSATHLVTEEDVNRVLEQQVDQQQSSKKRTPIDLCRFKSQRVNFVASSVVFFGITYLYFGPIIIISDLGLNIFVSQVVLGISQTISYPISFLFIEKSPRKLSGYILFSITAVLFGILIFVVPQENCNGCLKGIIQIVLVFIARFCICYYFSIFFLFVTEIFPLPLRGMGFGMGSAIAAIASSSGQFVLNAFEEINFNPMIMFSFFAVTCIAGTYFLPETHKKPLEEMIPEEKQEQLVRANQRKGHGVSVNSSGGETQSERSYQQQKNGEKEMQLSEILSEDSPEQH